MPITVRRGRGLSHIEDFTEEEAGIRHGRSAMPSACDLQPTKVKQGIERGNVMSMRMASAANASGLNTCQLSPGFRATYPKTKDLTLHRPSLNASNQHLNTAGPGTVYELKLL